jgi:hypothetical protein
MSEIRVNNIKNEAGTGAPTFPNGATVLGTLTGTATTATLATNAQGLTGTPNISVGTIGATSLNATGVVTATSGFSGNLTGNVTGNLTGNATGLSGTPDITVGSVVGSALTVSGISTLTDLRLASVADKVTVATNNSPSLAYNTGGGNIAVVYNATGPITLTVTGIPTTADFNNRSINFAVIVRQGATGYGCSSLLLNGVTFNSTAAVGVSTRISYPSGTVAAGSTSCYDVFNFIGINTTGSASTMTNYNFISIKNGDFRFY